MTFFNTDHHTLLQSQTNSSANNLFCVAVGSSAGGFEALKELFTNLSAGAGNFTVILSQTLEDEQFTTLQSLPGFNQYFTMCRPTEGMSLEPGVIYAAMPGEAVTIAHGKLCLQTGRLAVDNLTADALFQSAAVYALDKSIAVVLSGTGNDSSAGVKSVKAAGGKVLVQMPQTAKYDGMPRAAICTCCTDAILVPGDIAKKIFSITAQPALSLNNLTETMPPKSAEPQQGKLVVMSPQLVSLDAMVKETLYAGYQHVYILIDRAANIREINGDAALFLTAESSGLPCNLFHVLKKELYARVRSAVDNTIINGSVNRGNLEIIELSNKIIFIRIIIKPVENGANGEPLFVVIFENMDPESFVAKDISITGKLMVGAAMHQLASHLHQR